MNGPFEIEDDRGKFRATPLFKGGQLMWNCSAACNQVGGCEK